MSPQLITAEWRGYPRQTTAHALAASLIGLPWQAGAQGPDAFNCWGLVVHWHRELHGICMADIAIAVEQADGQQLAAAGHAVPLDQASQVQAIAAAARAGGWRRVPRAEPLDGDVALLRNGGTGGRHVGVVLWANARMCLLHCEGTNSNPMPGVLCEPLDGALRRYTHLELWRRTQ